MVKKKASVKFNSNNHWDPRQDYSSIFVFAAAGGLIGAFAAYLLAKRNSFHADEGLADRYRDFSDRVEEVGETIMEKGKNAYQAASDYAENLKEKTAKLLPEGTINSRNLLILGALSAGVLGVTSILLLTRRSRQESYARGKTGSFVKRQAIDWLEVAKEFTTALSSQLNPEEEGEEILQGSQAPSPFQDAVQIAALSMRLWNNMRKGK